jgi:hypothetical protein
VERARQRRVTGRRSGLEWLRLPARSDCVIRDCASGVQCLPGVTRESRTCLGSGPAPARAAPHGSLLKTRTGRPDRPKALIFSVLRQALKA